MSADPPRLPDLPLPRDPDLALPDIYVPPRTGIDDWYAPDDERRPRARPPVGERDEDRPLPRPVVALTRSVPALLVVLVAIAGRLASGFLPSSELPVVLLLIAAVQVVGYVVSRANDLWPWARTFLTNAAIVLAVLPLLAIQASATRVPYVSVELGTARPAILATVAAVVVLVAGAGATVVLAWEAPADAALLFLPAALLVPAMLGTRLGVTEEMVVGLVAEVFAIAALATFVAVLMPGGLGLLAGAVSLGLYFAFLLALDRGPTKEPTSDAIARILDGVLVAATIVLTVAVPLAALGVRRVMREVQAAERASLFERLVRD